MLTAREMIGQLDGATGTTYRYWTFNGKVPGPFIRVRQGDTVVITLNNDKSDMLVHSIDLHAALGPGGGAVLSQVPPGQSKTFSFQATIPGLYVYHCGTPMVAEHMANGMYGLILVEPAGGLPHVDHEYYVMQGEMYTTAPKGKPGLQQFSAPNLMQENAQYFVFNGSVDAANKQYPMHADVGQTVRIFFGNAGPNATASEHMIGEIFTKVYMLGSLTSPPLTGIQTVTVPPGGAAVLELKAEIPGKFSMMDHAITRMEKGMLAVLEVKGPENRALMHEGPTPLPPGQTEISAITPADMKMEAEAAPVYAGAPTGTGAMAGMADMTAASAADTGLIQPKFDLKAAIHSDHSLIGCMTVLSNGRVMLKVFHSQKVYRLEARPMLFSANANRLVRVTGYRGSVLAVEDPAVPSFAVDDLDVLAPDCATPVSAAAIRQQLAPPTAPIGGVVNMGHMTFVPATITINAGEQVVWKNTSDIFHDVVDDPGRAVSVMDVSLPSGTAPFASRSMAPNTVYAYVFDKPGVYRYVCVLHETSGMKGTVIVRAGSLVASRAGSSRQRAGQ
ncbi:MAG: plastocyanin/azurin family copper-binding protein [Acidobacteriaceae bacterium]